MIPRKCSHKTHFNTQCPPAPTQDFGQIRSNNSVPSNWRSCFCFGICKKENWAAAAADSQWLKYRTVVKKVNAEWQVKKIQTFLYVCWELCIHSRFFHRATFTARPPDFQTFRRTWLEIRPGSSKCFSYLYNLAYYLYKRNDIVIKSEKKYHFPMVFCVRKMTFWWQKQNTCTGALKKSQK